MYVLKQANSENSIIEHVSRILGKESEDEAGVMIMVIRSHCLVRQITTKNCDVQLFMQSAVKA